MRIGLVTGEYPPQEGGVGDFTERLARALAALGHEVHVITSRRARPSPQPSPGARGSALGAAEEPSPARRGSITRLREPVDLGYAMLHPRVSRWGWPSLSVVADVALRYDLEVVNLQYQAAAYDMRSPAVAFLPWRLRGVAPVVVTFHDLKVPYLFPKAGPLRAAVVRGLARRAAGVIATNPADEYALAAWGVTALRRIPIGSNITAHEPGDAAIAAVRAALGLSPGDVLLGYFGFLNETKGAATLIDALAQLDGRHHLVFIGGPTGASDPLNNATYLRDLNGRIAALRLDGRVHWTGFLPPAGVSAHLCAADVLVMPYRDGVSLRRGTLMAALAHGRPLITTQPAEPSPAFRHGDNMWLVAPDDAAGLAAAVLTLAGDGPLRARLGDGARALAASFSWPAIAAAAAAFYAEVRGEESTDYTD